MILDTITKVLQFVHYGSGWLLDILDTRDHWYERLNGRGPLEVLPKHGLPPLYQVGNSCAGRVVHALRISLVNHGRNCPELSALYNYHGSRFLRVGGSPTKDEGTTIRDSIKALVKYGAPESSFWPEVVGNVNRKPSLAASRMAIQRGLKGYYRVPAGDTDRIRAAIAEGYAVIAGWDLSSHVTARSVSVLTEAHLGRSFGHAMVIDGYTKGGSFCIVNSWRGWGSHGTAVATEGFVAAAKDVWVLAV